MKHCLISLILFLAFEASGTVVRIGLFGDAISPATDWQVAEGTYTLVTPASKKITLQPGQSFRIAVRDGRLHLSGNGIENIAATKIKMVALKADGIMRICPLKGGSWYTYGGHFEVQVQAGKIRIVNIAELEDYVAGVIESEAGANSSAEYLEVQGILCRTYCLGHLDRHAGEGYQLCDKVHCQVYRGKSRFNKLAKQAADSTHNEVLADSAGRLIPAVYHSNCGGRTLPADSVWSKHVSCLQPVTDTFCLSGTHAAWQVSIPAKDWKRYLKGETGIVTDTMNDSLFTYSPAGRMVWFYFMGKSVPLKKIRDDWKLNSTWFAIVPQADTMVFNGRGFGHGIGLCQEGAMQMAADGKTHAEIINFYFSGVRIVDAEALELLK